MKEVKLFENWTNLVIEGCWALPTTRGDQKKFLELMGKPLMAGPDGVNAKRQLDDVFGEDKLFDSITDVAEVDPNSDVRSLVIDHMESYARDNPGVAAVLSQINLQQGLNATPPTQEPVPAPEPPPPPEPEEPMEPPEGEEDVDLDMDMDLEEPNGDEEEMDTEFEEPVAEAKKYEYNRDLAQILKHAGVKDYDDPEKDDDDAVVDYEVSSYDRMDESCGEDCEDCEDCNDKKDIQIHGGHPVHDPELVRLKTLAGFPMVR